MASKKQEIRKQIKKKEAKELEELGLNPDVEVVDLNDDLGEDIQIETFEDVVKKPAQPIEFNTTPQKQKKGLFGSIKGAFSQDNKILKKLEKQAEQVLGLEATYQAMSDEELAHQTDIFRERINAGESLDDILIEAFATVREAAFRKLGLKAFKVQIMGAISLHNGDIAEMKTGEGKTLTSIFPVYLNALDGKGVHVVTVNDYLAGRDKTDNGKVLEFLGLTVGLNMRELTKEEKRAQHACDVTYTTNAELGFDYLRDNMVTRLEDKVLRPLNYALVDEVDSILVDESRTPLIISGGKKNTAALYVQADKFVKSLIVEKDYEVDIESKTVSLTSSGIEKAEKGFKINNLYDPEHTALVHHINQALKANYTMQRDVEYMIATEDGSHDIRNASIMIIDQFTGRVMPGRAYSDGLHQAIEAKEGVPIKEETVTLATITYQNFFRLFNKLAGMTGTAKTEEEEFRTIYNMRVIEIPTNKPIIRDDKPDLVFANQKAKFKAICDEVERRHSYGQPILLGTVSVETSELLSRMLNKRGIKHNVLNAKNHAKEALIIEKAGVMGAVTIATNMAGRGTDIKLGEGVYDLGGLMVIGSERHQSRRIDNQLRGRSGRQGDPGYTQFFVSMEDDLMVRFGSDRIKTMMQNMGFGDNAIQSKIITNSLGTAQARVEGNNFDIRKNILQYDDVMNNQREIIYEKRNKILDSESIHEDILDTFRHHIEDLVNSHLVIDGEINDDDIDEITEFANENLLVKDIKKSSLKNKSAEDIINKLYQQVVDEYQEKISILPEEVTNEFEKAISLQVIDNYWMEHINTMSHLREGIYLRGYAQVDPLHAYTMKDSICLIRCYKILIKTQLYSY